MASEFTPVSLEPPNPVASHRGLDPSRFEISHDIPIFDEHEVEEPQYDAEGNRVGTKKLRYTRKVLQAMAENMNRRIADTGDLTALCLGHTPTPEQRRAGVSQPPLVGFAGPFYVGTIGNEKPRAAIIAKDWGIYRDEADKVRKFPRRSVEVWREPDPMDRYIEPIALLGAEVPRRDLGLAYSRVHSGVAVERYTAMAPSGTNTFIPGGGDDEGIERNGMTAGPQSGWAEGAAGTAPAPKPSPKPMAPKPVAPTGNVRPTVGGSVIGPQSGYAEANAAKPAAPAAPARPLRPLHIRLNQMIAHTGHQILGDAGYESGQPKYHVQKPDGSQGTMLEDDVHELMKPPAAPQMAGASAHPVAPAKHVGYLNRPHVQAEHAAVGFGQPSGANTGALGKAFSTNNPEKFNDPGKFSEDSGNVERYAQVGQQGTSAMLSDEDINKIVAAVLELDFAKWATAQMQSDGAKAPGTQVGMEDMGGGMPGMDPNAGAPPMMGDPSGGAPGAPPPQPPAEGGGNPFGDTPSNKEPSMDANAPGAAPAPEEKKPEQYSATNGSPEKAQDDMVERYARMEDYNKKLAERLQAIEDQAVKSERYAKIDSWNFDYIIDRDAERGRADNYSKEQWDGHVEIVEKNYQRNPIASNGTIRPARVTRTGTVDEKTLYSKVQERAEQHLEAGDYKTWAEVEMEVRKELAQ